MSVVRQRKSSDTLQAALKGVLVFVGVIWTVFLLDQLLPLEQLGLVPRQVRGAVGIVAMPFLHGSLQHLLANTTPLAFLLFLLAGSQARSVEVVAMLAVVSGVLLWLFGREAVHIGASTLVFALGSFLIVTGLIERRLVSFAVAVLVVALYGSSFIAGVVPWQHGVSWDGHLAGLVGGALVAPIALRQVAGVVRR
ncbi:MAG: rhomboid family intramembrane serine protease [Pseudomonadota bacterium]